MPYLILSDIHANTEALDAVLSDARGLYGRIVCLGDLVGYGAEPNAVVDWAHMNCAIVIRGNHDRACAGNDTLETFNPAARFSALWTRRQLTPQNLDYLQRLPRGPATYEGLDLIHGSPADEDEYLVTLGDVEGIRDLLISPMSLFGHTHVQGGFLLTRNGARRISGQATQELRPTDCYLMNPGSVGQPRDRDPRAAYALYNPENHLFEFRRVAYDVERAASKICAAGLPAFLATRLHEGI